MTQVDDLGHPPARDCRCSLLVPLTLLMLLMPLTVLTMLISSTDNRKM